MRQLILILFLASTLHAVKCPEATLAATGVRTTREELLKVEVANEGMDTSVPADVQNRISVLKDRLVDLADAVLACTGSTQRTASIEKVLADYLGPREPSRTSKPPEGTDESVTHIFGIDTTAVVSAPRTEFVFVELSFGINCGSDSVLLLYQATNHRWKRVLRWQSPKYDKASGAFGDFFHYSLIKDAKTNELAVVTAHGYPWCTSRWSGFNIDALYPAIPSRPQRQIFHEEFGYVREEKPRWKSLPSGFEMRTDNAFFDLAVMTKKVVFRFLLEDGTLSRVQPIAMDGMGFVDEWFQSPWDQAQQWAEPIHRQTLRSWHEKTRQQIKAAQGDFNYGPLRSCGDSFYEAELNTDKGWRSFIKLQQLRNGFLVVSVSTAQTCSGKSVLAKQ